MSVRRLLSLPVMAVLAVALAGCGGGSKSSAGSVEAGAAVVPASAAAYVSLNTDTSTSQWKAARALLDKFPGQAALLKQLGTALGQQGLDFGKDVEPALGNEVDLAVLAGAKGGRQSVVLTKPADASKLDALLAKSRTKLAHEVVDGWTVVSDTQAAIDAFKQARGSGGMLADDKTFKDALAGLPVDAEATFYVEGSALGQALGGSAPPAASGSSPLRSVAGVLVAKGDGAELKVQTRGGPSTGTEYSAGLLSQVPAGALLYLSFKDLGQSLASLQLPSSVAGQLPKQLQGLPGMLGPALQALGPLLEGEGALYLRAGMPIPEVTLVLEEQDPQAALAAVDGLVGQLGALGSLLGGAPGAPQATTLDGIPAKRIDLGPVSIYYAAVDGKLVVTDETAGITGLRGTGPKLADDAAFKAAKTAAGMPGKTLGFAYVDLKDAVPAILGLAQLGGASAPSSVSQNLAPLRSLVVYSTREGDVTTVTAFLGVQ